MGDNFDFCECINHESAMQRLISLLRSTQNYCTDNECLTDMPGSNLNRIGGQGGFEMSSTFMIFGLWLVLAILLYVFRPSSLRTGNGKPTSHDEDNDYNDRNPPAPPIH
ncbi:small integral membrane protein 14-like [Gordionus sp. m RMFG-2023]|uniref:small integral membrane protein 14-like n=1 Tax=Gordionus sp. m RMFG-2023 TaxID=3053472 RepID=UPI0031FC9C7E